MKRNRWALAAALVACGAFAAEIRTHSAPPEPGAMTNAEVEDAEAGSLKTSRLAVPPGPADLWLSGPAEYPAPHRAEQVRTDLFAGLQAQVTAGQLRLQCPADPVRDATNAWAWISVDPPGHWPARDWRVVGLNRQGGFWTADVPVFDLDLPLVYFAGAGWNGGEAISPMRVTIPRELGLMQPTRLFWPLLDGFEDGLVGWKILAPQAAGLRLDSAAHVGGGALAVSLPRGHHSVTVATTRLRPWHVWKLDQRGVRVWVRAREGAARARISLIAHAGTTNQTVAVLPRDVRLTNAWTQVDVSFAEFPQPALHAVDLLALEFIGNGPQEFLVDDLQVLGRDNLAF